MSDYEYESDGAVYELADVGNRFIALIIDNVVLGIITGVLYSIFGNSGSVAGFLIGLGYNWYFWTQHNGQTPGKSVMGIRVVKADGTPFTGTDALLRYVGYFINSFVFGLGYLWALWDGKHRGWHDMIARTYVVVAKSGKTKRKVEELDLM